MEKHIEIKLDTYEGPLELLYHQLKKNKIDICTIGLAQIADQYLNYIQEMDMNSKSEFLLIAAELIGIKTKMLLQGPKEEHAAEELVNRLEIYESFVNISHVLNEMHKTNIYYRDNMPKSPPPTIKIGIEPSTLMQIFLETIKRAPEADKPLQVVNLETETYSLEQTVDRLYNTVLNKGNVNFTEILSKINALGEKIIMFLALLELMAAKKIHITQSANFEEILVKIWPSEGGCRYG